MNKNCNQLWLVRNLHCPFCSHDILPFRPIRCNHADASHEISLRFFSNFSIQFDLIAVFTVYVLYLRNLHKRTLYRKLYESRTESPNMISQEITLNGKKYRLTLTDQVLSDVRRLKALYNAAYEDPESFEEVSSAISDTINQIANAVEPSVSDSDLDGLIQSVMKAVDEKSKEAEDARAKHAEEKAKAEKSTSKPKKSKK